ncbi:MAG: hypothetical protein GY853_16470 [PVC group bacterium]|nr:hypothetical protein [PVC group bacterium]
MTNPKVRKNMKPKVMSNSVMSKKIGMNNTRLDMLEKENIELKKELALLRVELKDFLPKDEEEEVKEIEEFEVENRACETCSELNMEDKNCKFHVEQASGFPCKKWKKNK